jgi:hypothetical protein
MNVIQQEIEEIRYKIPWDVNRTCDIQFMDKLKDLKIEPLMDIKLLHIKMEAGGNCFCNIGRTIRLKGRG